MLGAAHAGTRLGNFCPAFMITKEKSPMRVLFFRDHGLPGKRALVMRQIAAGPRALEHVPPTFRLTFIHSRALLKDSSTAANSVLRGVRAASHRRCWR
jgi:hypothetical protein